MQPDAVGLGLIKKVALGGFLHVSAEFLPTFALGENVVREAFGHVTAVAFLSDVKYNFHVMTMARGRVKDKREPDFFAGFAAECWCSPNHRMPLTAVSME